MRNEGGEGGGGPWRRGKIREEEDQSAIERCRNEIDKACRKRIKYMGTRKRESVGEEKWSRVNRTGKREGRASKKRRKSYSRKNQTENYHFQFFGSICL
ncbi:hypothetical protein PoB_005368500 [Plakobranchus ocellatus]|uniref:Uncharacterized protein n=1 Tax=Plakobranchus ocellatus TaxID=259542 RepID=A0AAV4C6V9_9GAST|nr:hypothetical protein PoB_005368500 [Plakobranchus ocellatus]